MDRAKLAAVDPKWWVLLAVGVGSLLGAIDLSVANIVLPVVRREFACSVATIEWAVTIYLLVVCGFLLSFGRLGDLRGQKRLYIAGFVVFMLGSAACGAAWSATALIAARAFQALGASMIFATVPAILTGNFPATQRGQALGLQAIMIYLGQMTGPALGGWLTDHFSWRAVFYINLPVGALAILLSTRFIPRDEPKKQTEPFDFAGAGLFLAGFSLLLLGLNQGYDRGWTSPSIQGLLAGGLLLLIGFVLLEHRSAHPLLDLNLFREPQFAMSVASAVLNYLSVYTITFLMPFYLIQGRGLIPSHAGLLITIQPAMMAVSAPISGTLSDRLGTRWLSMAGMAILGTGLLLLSRLQPGSSLAHVGLGVGVCGLGTGMFITPNNSALMGAAPPHRQGIAAGMLGTARYVGMILGVGIAGAVFTTFLARHTPTALFEGIRASFLVASISGFLGCLTSAVRREQALVNGEPVASFPVPGDSD
ncbi:MAG: MFS transporter [Candidatus Korobacteraceae bacterium]